MSGLEALELHLALMALSSLGVIGNLGHEGVLGARLIPRSTYWSVGQAPGVKGSPWPAIMWWYRMAER